MDGDVENRRGPLGGVRDSSNRLQVVDLCSTSLCEYNNAGSESTREPVGKGYGFGNLAGMTFDKAQWNRRTRGAVQTLQAEQKALFESFFSGKTLKSAPSPTVMHCAHETAICSVNEPRNAPTASACSATGHLPLRSPRPSTVSRLSAASVGAGEAVRASRRILVPANFTGGRIVSLLKDQSTARPGLFPPKFLEQVENQLEAFVARLQQLLVVAVIEEKVGANDRASTSTALWDYLAAYKPPRMSTDLFLLMCQIPLGITAAEYLRMVNRRSAEDVSIQQTCDATPLDTMSTSSKLSPFADSSLNSQSSLQQWQLSTKEAFAEYRKGLIDASKVLLKLKSLNGTLQKWKAMEQELSEKLILEMVDTEVASTDGLRCSASRQCLMWGRVRNMLSWKEGDPVDREEGFHLKALRQRSKNCREQKDMVFNAAASGNLTIGHLEFHRKRVQDCAREQREVKKALRICARKQAILEFARMPPKNDSFPPEAVLWKCMGLSYHSRMWQVYHCPTTLTMVAKIQPNHPKHRHIRGAGQVNLAKDLKDAIAKIRRIDPLRIYPDLKAAIMPLKAQRRASTQPADSAIDPTATPTQTNCSSASNERLHKQWKSGVPTKSPFEDPTAQPVRKRYVQTTLLQFIKPDAKPPPVSEEQVCSNQGSLTPSNGGIEVPDHQPLLQKMHSDLQPLASRESVIVEQPEEPLTHSTSKVVFSRDCFVYADTTVELTPLIPREVDLATYLDESGVMCSPDDLLKAKWIILELIRAVLSLGNITFLLPIKCSRIYLTRSSVTFCAGLPKSLIRKRSWPHIGAQKTIASEIWGDTVEQYLPPELPEVPRSTKSQIISKAHSWMIGQVFYRMTCHPYANGEVDTQKCVDDNHHAFLMRVLARDACSRPSLAELARDSYLRLTGDALIPTITAKGLRSSFKVLKALEAFPSLQRIFKDNRPVFYEDGRQVQDDLSRTVTEAEEEEYEDDEAMEG